MLYLLTRPGLQSCVLLCMPPPRCLLSAPTNLSFPGSRTSLRWTHVLLPSSRKAVRSRPPQQWARAKRVSSGLCGNTGGHGPLRGARGAASFLLAKVTPDRGLINGATSTGTFCPAFGHMHVFCVVAEIQEIHFSPLSLRQLIICLGVQAELFL